MCHPLVIDFTPVPAQTQAPATKFAKMRARTHRRCQLSTKNLLCVLFTSRKPWVVGAYQRKLEELARVPGLELTAIVPAAWQEGRTALRLERAHGRLQAYRCAAGLQRSVPPPSFFPSLPLAAQAAARCAPHGRGTVQPRDGTRWPRARGAAEPFFFTWQNLARRYPWPFRRIEQVNYRRAVYALAGKPGCRGRAARQGLHRSRRGHSAVRGRS